MAVKPNDLSSFPVWVTMSRMTDTGYHNHNYYEFVYVLEGMVDHIINGEHHILREDNYFLLDPKDEHMYVSINDEPFRIINFMFDPALIDANFTLDTPFKEIIKHPLIGISPKKLSTLPLTVQFSDDSRTIKNMFTDSLNEYRQKKPGYLNVLRANVVKIIINCLRNVYENEDFSKKSAFVDTITKYVNEHYSENISLSELCDKLGYSVQYVSRAFKTQIGVNFSEYLKKVRVQKACSLLLSTDMTIQQIVNAVGYSNIAFFYKAFKKIMGETPMEFRNR